jgi:transposase-like protein
VKRWWTDEERARAVELYLRGHSLERVGRELGRGHSSVRYAITRAGVTLRPPVGPSEASERLRWVLDRICSDCLTKIARG